MRVYLAGPINAKSDDEAVAWREVIKTKFGDKFTYLDPMDRDFRGIEGDHTQEIVEGDLRDIQECDLFVANAWTPSFGTAMEVFYASHVLGKVVLCVAPKPHSPWLTYHASSMFESMEDLIEHLEQQ